LYSATLNYPLLRFPPAPLAPPAFFAFFVAPTRFAVFSDAARFAVFVAIINALAPFAPPPGPVIPTEAGRRICFSASLLRSSRPAKWRDLSSLFISVKTQFEDKTGAKQKRPEVLLRAVLITKSLSVNS
jgi:hypothetical protein